MSRPISEVPAYELLHHYEDLLEQHTGDRVAEGDYTPPKPESEERVEALYPLDDIRKELNRRLGLTEPNDGNNCKLTLKSFGPLIYETGKESSSTKVAKYELKHSTPGRSGTVLTLDVEVHIDLSSYVQPDQVKIIKAKVDMSGVEANSIDEALNKLAEWAQRAGEALKNRERSKILLPT